MTNLLFRVFFIIILGFYSKVSLGLSQDIGSDRSSYSFNEEYVDSLLNSASAIMSKEETLHLAINELELAYDISKSINYREGIINSCNHLGGYYLSLSDHANATLYFYLMLRETEIEGDSTGIANAYIGLGLVMYNMNKWEDALQYLSKAEKTLLSIDNNPRNVKLVYYLEGLCLMHLGEYYEAGVLLKNCNKRAQAEGDSMRLYESALALNRIEIETNLNESVLDEFEEIQEYFERKEEQVGVCYALQGKALAHLKLGNATAAREFALEALKIARHLKLLYPITENISTLIKAEEMLGYYESAYTLQKELNKLKDSTNSIEVASQIAMLGAAHRFEKKESELDEEIKRKNRQRTFFLILFIATFIVALVIVYMLRLVGKQRKLSDNLLRNILPRQTINELRDHGSSLPKAHTNVTVVFADVVSFTKIASTLTPQVLVQMLDRYFSKFDAIVVKYDLEKIKTIGDAYMFVSGLLPRGNSAENAALGCLDMVAAIDDMRDEMNREFGVHFEFRIGMHTGNVVSGVVGEIKYAFDIWGDAVNVASRMEDHSLEGKINVSKYNMSLLKDKFSFTPRGSFDIKNRGNIEMYFLEGKLE
ncbi:hypothetical protein GYB22_08570 [bacterium]|nr:hypothetical protein [bacterium]